VYIIILKQISASVEKSIRKLAKIWDCLKVEVRIHIICSFLEDLTLQLLNARDKTEIRALDKVGLRNGSGT
jgi:hypothetical protein